MKLREVLIKVRDGGINESFDMANFLKSCGFIKGQHVGTPPDEFTDQMTIEWYLGQGIQIVDEQSWFAMNSWLNCIEKYIPEHYEVNTNYFEEELFTI